jgi:hypothetical protein
MAKERDVHMVNGGIGSDRTRKSRSEQIDEKKSEEMQRVASQAGDIFAKLEQEKIEAERRDESARAPRLADFKVDVEVANWVFTLRTLTGSEQRELLAKIMSLKADQRLIYAKPFTIGMAISTINGVPLEPASVSAGFEDPMDFICSWQDPLIERLYDEYEKLFSSSKSIFTKETLEADLKK